jgi:hypothetical protein
MMPVGFVLKKQYLTAISVFLETIVEYLETPVGNPRITEYS